MKQVVGQGVLSVIEAELLIRDMNFQRPEQMDA